MAQLTVRNATVDRIFYNGKGVSLHETFTSRGEERKAYYTAWFENAPDVTEGQVLPEVSGLFSVKEEEFDGKDGQKRRAIKTSLNNARITGTPTAAQPASDWSASGNDETPF